MVTDYINYFRSLAIRHKDIKHDPQSDLPEPTGQKHFTRISIEEVLKGMQSTVFFPCLCLELYETEVSAQNAISVKLLPQGAFMVVDHPADDSFQAQQDCYARCERIMYEILQQIYQDHRPGSDACARPFHKFEFDRITINPVGPVFTGQFGYRAEFFFELQNTIDITQPPAAGIFNS